MLRSSFGARGALLRPSAFRASHVVSQPQHRQAHAISNPTLANIEDRWVNMPPQEQADLWMALRDRMKGNWHELTLAEKKAAYWIAFGSHGPRAEPPPGESWRIVRYTAYGVLISAVIFYVTRMFSGSAPKTMTREWQEATNERMKEEKIEPITGVSSAGYKGLGMIQSKPSGKSADELSEEED